MPTPARRAHARPPRRATGPLPELEAIETRLRDWIGDPLATASFQETARAGAGRPPVLPAVLLWSGLLVCLLRGFHAQRELWRLLSLAGLWNFPRIDVGPMAVYQRLKRASAAVMETFFLQVTAALQAHLADRRAVPYAAFATEIYAVDQSVLDPLMRKLQILRGHKKGAHALLPGVLACLFDLRRQQWAKVVFSDHALQNEKPGAPALVAEQPKGSLFLFDLGYFSFFWFDYLLEQGFHFVSRVRSGTSFAEETLLYAGSQYLPAGTRLVTPAGVEVLKEGRTLALRETLGYLGAHDSDRAAHLVRRIEVRVGAQTWEYVTDVLDPRVFPAWEVVALYGFRWDIESAFNLLKTHLGLHLLWSGHRSTMLHQVYGTLLLSQIVLALRFEIAEAAGAEVREVSLELMLRWLPQLAKEGRDPVAELVRMGRRGGFIRPFRGKERHVLRPSWEAYSWPEPLPPPRAPRYGDAPRPPAHEEQMAVLRARYGKTAPAATPGKAARSRKPKGAVS
jgi:hypothetical protein